MNKLLATTALAGFLLASPVYADGFYVGGETGYGWSTDAGIDHKTDYPGGEFHHLKVAPFQYDWNSSLGSSIMGGLAVGYEYKLPATYGVVRFELGTNYRPGFSYDKMANYDSFDSKKFCYEDVCSKSLSITASKKLMTDISSIAVMTNAYYDAKQWGYAGNNFAIYPSVGAGLGFARNKVDDVKGQLNYAAVKQFNSPWHNSTHNYDGQQDFNLEGDTNISFAWQVMGGVGMDFPQGWSGSLMYRYADLGSGNTGTKLTSSGSFGSSEATVDAIKGDLHVHEIVLGVRKTF